jgi:CrcB protein
MSAALPTWLSVTIAGALGVLARFALGGWLVRATGGLFPWETMIINVSGCFAIGALAGALDRGALLSPALRMALLVGFLGGYTTFSSFALEALRLVQDAQWRSAALYVLGTNAAGLVAVWAGYQGVRLVSSA